MQEAVKAFAKFLIDKAVGGGDTRLRSPRPCVRVFGGKRWQIISMITDKSAVYTSGSYRCINYTTHGQAVTQNRFVIYAKV